MEVKAKLSNLSISPRKVRLVVDLVRGLGVAEAEAQLIHSPKQASKPILTLLKSAVANAEHNFKMKKDDLFVKEIFADEAKTAYRYQPRAFGRATPLRQRASHVSIILTSHQEVVPVKEEKKTKPAVKKAEAKKAEKPAVKKATKPAAKKAAVKKPAAKKPAAKKEETPKDTKK